MKAHGVGEDEVERCKLDILADLETAYLERDQIPSADHAAEAIEHFLRDEPLIDLELELEMCKKMLKTISADEVGAQARLHAATSHPAVLFSILQDWYYCTCTCTI